MASIYQNIRATLEKTLNDITDIPDIAWENRNYSPTTGTSYVKPIFLPGSRQPAFRGLNPQQRYAGIFQVLCFVDENTGPNAADVLADKILNAFEATTDISYSGTIVTIGSAEREGAFYDSPWYYVPVNISWYIYA